LLSLINYIEGVGVAKKEALKLLKKQNVDEFNKWVKQRRKKGKKAVDLDDLDLSGLDLRGLDLRDAHLNGTNLRKTNLKRANLKRARLRQADLRATDFTEADLTDADLRRSKQRGTVFSKAILKNAKGV